MRKLGLHSTAEIVHYAIRNQIVQPLSQRRCAETSVFGRVVPEPVNVALEVSGSCVAGAGLGRRVCDRVSS